MSGREVLVDDVGGRLHAAIVRKTVLDDLYIDSLDATAAWGSIYLGRVTKIDKKLDAAIVDLGNGQTGFLPAKHVHYKGGDESERRSSITALLKNGQSIVVQIKSEAKRGSQHEQHKMPRLTTKLYIMGHHLTYCPLSSPVTMSRQVGRKDVLSMTAKLKTPGGWILQAHADAADIDVLREEALKLLAEWQVILAVKAEGGDKPHLLKGGPNALQRVLFDYGADAFDHIHIGNKKLLDTMLRWCAHYDPPLATSKRLRLFRPDKPSQRLFDIHDVFGEMEALKENLINLRCGGSIIIEITHAMIIVDVNQGSAPGAMVANEEAVVETARQVRMRNLSGAVLVDCIGLDERSQRAHLVETFEGAFENDPASAQVHGLTRLGIIEVTRKRRTAWNEEKLKN